MEARASTFVTQQWALPPGAITLDVQPVRGGLESTVARVTVRQAIPASPAPPRRFIVKELRGPHRRETQIYELLWRTFEQPPAARVFGSDMADDSSCLYLEDVPRASNWPWRNYSAAAAVCEALAELHDAPVAPGAVPEWDYDAELAWSADTTVQLAVQVTGQGTAPWSRLGDLKRVVAALPEIRARLMKDGMTLVHGDVHPGNVIVRPGGPPYRIAFIDWARARPGSPLEDVASWLHSLGCWDREARRRHDSLLRAYLHARHPMQPLDQTLRETYWLASACNGLAGAIRYHLAVLAAVSSTTRARRNSMRALAEWERVIRGASSVLRPRGD